MRGSLRLLVIGAVVSIAAPAEASFHLMSIDEVYPGSPAAPSAQYVMLRMYFGGQNFVGGTSIAVYSATNAELGRFTFAGSVSNDADQATILIATSQAQTFFGVTANLTMTAILPQTGGKVCFEAGVGNPIDCVAWGNHPGSASGGVPGNVGVPFRSGFPFLRGRAVKRRQDISGSPTNLDGSDDTNNCATDFMLVLPAPRNNAGQSGVIPPSACGNNSTESIESCDDGNMTSGDGCSGACVDEFCGDSAMNDVDETCDDGNLISGDGCDANCRVTGCGSGIITTGETCDDGNLTSGDGCDANCTPTGCGNAIQTTGEMCDDGNLTSGDGCDANCTPTGCGNGIVTAGEACEPPNVGLCSATCQLGCGNDAACADTNPCTMNEHCVSMSCVVNPTPTDDMEPCTVDACDMSGVTHTALANGMSCTLATMPSTRALCVAGACTVASCGDGYTDANAPNGPEQCDDGNMIDTDTCTSMCKSARCGDGFTQPGEQCDDANAVDTDACAACMAAKCGDTFIQPGETCDDGNTLSGDGCTGACAIEVCGDGIVQASEDCDDGNNINGDLCSSFCTDEIDPVPPGDDGGCCNSQRGPAGPVGLALLVLCAICRRRRRTTS